MHTHNIISLPNKGHMFRILHFMLLLGLNWGEEAERDELDSDALRFSVQPSNNRSDCGLLPLPYHYIPLNQTYTYIELTNATVADCRKKCVAISTCGSFNYYSSNDTCHVLISVSHDGLSPMALSNDAVILYYIKTCISAGRSNIHRRDIECYNDQHCEGKEVCVNYYCTCERSCYSNSPVCGSDGITYSSKCHLDKTSCKNHVTIHVTRHGRCRKTKSKSKKRPSYRGYGGIRRPGTRRKFYKKRRTTTRATTTTTKATTTRTTTTTTTTTTTPTTTTATTTTTTTTTPTTTTMAETTETEESRVRANSNPELQTVLNTEEPDEPEIVTAAAAPVQQISSCDEDSECPEDEICLDNACSCNRTCQTPTYDFTPDEVCGSDNVMYQSQCDFIKHRCTNKLNLVEVECPVAQDCLTDSILKFRTADGTCNNLRHKFWGSTGQAFRRMLRPDYADGLSEPRKAKDGGDLPSARKVSISITKLKEKEHPRYSLMVMQFGQIVDHDLTLTPGATGPSPRDPDCCNGLQDSHCFTIPIPAGDPKTNTTCMHFFRSASDSGSNQVRQQKNEITAYMDCSFIYGSFQEQLNNLRTMEGGKLRSDPHPRDATLKRVLPPQPDKVDCFAKPSHHCFLTGNGRVNELVTLSALHTIFMREHNRIAEELKSLNSAWDDEKLFQEARRIVVAEFQFITYKEYLGVLLGSAKMKRWGLKLKKTGFYSGYQRSMDASLFNVFSAAAYRFGHSLVGDFLEKSTSFWTSNAYFQPEKIFQKDNGGVDWLMGALLKQKCEVNDIKVTKDIRDKLFINVSIGDSNEFGTDLVARNIQRGRDHGLPGYNKWREDCKMDLADDFDDLVEMPSGRRQKFKNVYTDVDDIDLYLAGLAENHVTGGILGPTFACIIGRQFKRTRDGDRFWFENPKKVSRNSFSEEQLQSIRKVKLARILCDNMDNITEIQKKVMKIPHITKNPKVPCTDLASLDLTLWQV